MANSMTNALLNNVATGIAAGETSKLANIAVGGQLGLGARLPLIDAATPQVFSPVVAIVTHTPSMFKQVQHADSILKALVERHAKSITGIDFGYTLDSQDTPAGHDGQTIKMPTAAKRTEVNPTFVWQEIQGNLVWRFFMNWIRMIRHPDTNASSLAALTPEGELNPMLLSSFTMDVCFIQFDPTMRPENIIDVSMITAMWPQETGLIGMQREIGTTQLQERSIPFNGVIQHNDSTFVAGQNIARALNLHRANFDKAPAVAAQIEEKLADKGISAEIEEITSEFGA